MIQRRRFLAMLGALGAAAFVPRRADGGVARAISLTELTDLSDRIVLATALEAWSHWEDVGGRRRIVTWSRLGVDQALDEKGGEAELLVRTLGGRVGKIGQIVHGEALILVGQPAVVFARHRADGEHDVVAMAQGHFPVVDANGGKRLAPSPRLSDLVGDPDSAVRALVGKTVPEARKAVSAARPR